ncbi:MAG: hypothetical protein J6V79_00835 [Bacilli bacterium]|nr:hypothetical protein [Bacilli bacterium]
MFSNSYKKTFAFLSGVCLMLSSCVDLFENKVDLSAAFLNNVVWSSKDEKIKIICEGWALDRGYGIVNVNDESMFFQVLFIDNYDSLSFFINDKDDPRYFYGGVILDLRVKSISETNELNVNVHSNITGDKYYDEYSTTLVSRPIREDELDARYSGCAWIDEEANLFIHNNLNYLNPSKNAEFQGNHVLFSYCDDKRFEIKYDDDVVFASGNYVTHFDYMDLFFDEGRGKEEFGESLRMYTAYASGLILSLSDMKN